MAKNTILTEKDYDNFYKTIIYGYIEDELSSSIKSAYRDMCRTLSGFSKNPEKEEIRKNSVEILHKQIQNLIDKKDINQEMFDEWHLNTCKKLIQIFGNQKLFYGQAQKWINMSLKNLSMLNHSKVNHFYEYCHIPIDNYILEETGYKFNTSWSRIDNYKDYLNFQKWFNTNYKGIPLDEEFELWMNHKNKV